MLLRQRYVIELIVRLLSWRNRCYFDIVWQELMQQGTFASSLYPIVIAALYSQAIERD